MQILSVFLSLPFSLYPSSSPLFSLPVLLLTFSTTFFLLFLTTGLVRLVVLTQNKMNNNKILIKLDYKVDHYSEQHNAPLWLFWPSRNNSDCYTATLKE